MNSNKYEKINISCPVCYTDPYKIKWKSWNKVDDPIMLYGAASGIPGTQNIVECIECGMIYENPRFANDVILKGYMESKEAGHDSQYSMRVYSFLRTLRTLSSLLPKAGARVLDIGTAGGAFLDAAAQYGYQAVGLEPSRYLVDQGVKRGLRIYEGTIETHGFAKHSFDLICLWDVIEHLTEPRNALQRILPLLKPDGLLLINYPDIGTWQAKFAGRRFWWILSVHLHYFSRPSIRRICDATGFEVFHFQRYWQTLQFGYLEDMAIHYKVPLSGLMKRITPDAIQRIPIPYYASQTTALARIKK